MFNNEFKKIVEAGILDRLVKSRKRKDCHYNNCNRKVQ